MDFAYSWSCIGKGLRVACKANLYSNWIVQKSTNLLLYLDWKCHIYKRNNKLGIWLVLVYKFCFYEIIISNTVKIIYKNFFMISLRNKGRQGTDPWPTPQLISFLLNNDSRTCRWSPMAGLEHVCSCLFNEIITHALNGWPHDHFF